MHLNHLDLPVTDIRGTREFFEKYFDFRCVFERSDGLTVLLDPSDFALTLSPCEQGDRPSYPTGFHVGFNLSTKSDLMNAYQRLSSGGVEIVRPLGDLGGALTFHCNAPGLICVEVAWRER
jgi:lactoylglutathione lyase